jgi:hypothetical protein
MEGNLDALRVMLGGLYSLERPEAKGFRNRILNAIRIVEMATPAGRAIASNYAAFAVRIA